MEASKVAAQGPFNRLWGMPESLDCLTMELMPTGRGWEATRGDTVLPATQRSIKHPIRVREILATRMRFKFGKPW
ncbi:hypothetical protein DMENIID0001_159750 [Sergentomyia squamirostris]